MPLLLGVRSAEASVVIFQAFDNARRSPEDQHVLPRSKEVHAQVHRLEKKLLTGLWKKIKTVTAD